MLCLQVPLDWFQCQNLLPACKIRHRRNVIQLVISPIFYFVITSSIIQLNLSSESVNYEIKPRKRCFLCNRFKSGWLQHAEMSVTYMIRICLFSYHLSLKFRTQNSQNVIRAVFGFSVTHNINRHKEQHRKHQQLAFICRHTKNRHHTKPNHENMTRIQQTTHFTKHR